MTQTTTAIPGRGKAPKGLKISRIYTTPGVHPYDQIAWERRDIVMTNWRDGSVNFEQHGVEFPTAWSVNAANIVTTKYFRGAVGHDNREWSLKQLIDRVVHKYTQGGIDNGYFATDADAEIFDHELKHMLVNQVFSFNSPVWFNVGTTSPQQVSACFILAVDDSLESILNWYREEGMIFKGGSGAGLNLSRIRSSKELLSSGGTASGPVSFMRGADASAGTIKSGGATRRAAKMVVLDVDHPDIEEFINTKMREEDKIRALRDAGFDMDLGGTDIVSVQYQNANNSVRVSNEFMTAVETGSAFGLRARSTGEVIETVDAKTLWRKLATAAWECADPGIQYDDTINDWHTNPESGRITASNPCFTGDTLVAVADGRNAVRIDELAAAAMPVDVYTKDGNGRTVIRKMKDIRRTRENTPIVEVTLDDGTTVRCTPDHLFMLRDGSYLPASELAPGTALRRFDSEVVSYGSETGSLRRRVTGKRGWNWQHHLIAERNLGQYRDGLGGYHLDHVDGDSLNDAFANLQVLTAAEHAEKSAAEHMNGDANPARRLMNPTWKANISAAMAGSGNPRYIDVDTRVLAEVYRDAVIDDPKASKRQGHVAWNVYVRENGLVGQVPLANGRGRVRGMEWDEFVRSLSAVGVNHKVVSVVPAGFADVFDGEVEDTHNFAVITTSDADLRTGLLSGVFVHNCSEYMSLDNSSCNLASLNLMHFLNADDTFDAPLFRRAVELVITAMDISICFADFPTAPIGETTRNFRQLGIGYANLGALLMATGHAYDSDGGRALAGAITAVMTGTSYRRSAEIAGIVGPYSGFARNADAHRRVIRMHAAGADAARSVNKDDKDVMTVARAEWAEAVRLGDKHGFRNAQASVIAPTGTIGLMMDCDTTGLEPDLALVKHKKLVGGGSMEIVNQQVPRALHKLGYPDELREAIEAFIVEHGHVVGAPGLKTEHYEVFDCAMGDERSISAMGHVHMMAAIQPFVSGALSKTVNLPSEATIEDVEDVYFQGWKLGLKAIAIYRNNSKVGQPLNVKGAGQAVEPQVVVVEAAPSRKRLGQKRLGETTSFSIAGAEGYMTANAYEDGTLGEVFIKMSKQGSTLAGVMDAFSVSISIGLQYGVPLSAFVKKYTNMRFEPAGMTEDPDVRIAQSIMDYLFRRIALDYMPYEERAEYGIFTNKERLASVQDTSYDVLMRQDEVVPENPHAVGPVAAVTVTVAAVEAVRPVRAKSYDSPLCMTCGVPMEPAGSCHICRSCGSTSGCS